MNNTMEAKAAQRGVSDERIAMFKSLRVKADQLNYFMGLDDDILEQSVNVGLFADELYLVLQDHSDSRYMRAYVQLRQRGLTARELRPIQRPDHFLLGLDADLPRSVLKRADKKGIAALTLIDGKRARVAIEHMFQIDGMRQVVDLLPYIHCRQEGYSHQQLVEVLELADPAGEDFDCVAYSKVRRASVTHEQVMDMLEKLFDKKAQRAYYVEHVTAEFSLGHDVALDLASRGISLRRYIEVSEDLTYQQIVDGLDSGISLDSLLECVDFQQANSHIQLDEVLRYYRMVKHFAGIDVYVSLIDAGITHAEIHDAYEHKLSMNVYGRLRSQRMGLSHDDAISVVNHDIDPEYYMKLRREGMDHATAIVDIG